MMTSHDTRTIITTSNGNVSSTNISSSSPSASTPTKYLGVTPPISLAGPTERDLSMTVDMEETLRASDFFEADEESIRREMVLGKLNALVREFVRQVAQLRHLPEPLASETSGKIYTFGSYRLGVHAKGADIDTLCVAPQHVERADFFGLFYEMLEAHSEVTGLTQVPDAYVPVIKMKFSGISIDLVFARLNLLSIPEDLDLCDSGLLRNLDEKCILSLNGSRTTDEILKLVPDTHTFHLALRCIKLWAKRRGIYSNAMGYVAGVALALLTARICQLYPKASPSTIVTRLFKIYQQWPWPQPVYLKPIEDLPNLPMKVWNPRIHVADRFHKMPVITPAYPSMCSTHNVTASTLRLITDEFRRGADLMLRIEQRRADWADLLAPTDFFTRYRNFFQILAVSESEEAHLVWSGFLGSKLRHLTPKLELEEHIEAAPPFHEGFELMVEGESLEDVRAAHFYPKAKQDQSSSENKDQEAPHDDKHASHGDKHAPHGDKHAPHDDKHAFGKTGKKLYYTMAFYVALIIAPPDPNRKGPRRLCLDNPVNDFKSFISAYEKLTSDMHIIIRDIKRENLPDYCFTDIPRPPHPSLGPAGGRPTTAIVGVGGGSGETNKTVVGEVRKTIVSPSIQPSSSQASPITGTTEIDGHLFGSPKRTRTREGDSPLESSIPVVGQGHDVSS